MRTLPLLCILATFVAALANAQSRAATEMWDSNDCLNVAYGGGWRASDICRIRVTPVVWDIYTRGDPSRTPKMQLNMSWQGWIEVDVYGGDVVLVVPNRNTIVGLFEDLPNTYALGLQGTSPVQQLPAGTPRVVPPPGMLAQIQRRHWPAMTQSQQTQQNPQATDSITLRQSLTRYYNSMSSQVSPLVK